MSDEELIRRMLKVLTKLEYCSCNEYEQIPLDEEKCYFCGERNSTSSHKVDCEYEKVVREAEERLVYIKL